MTFLEIYLAHQILTDADLQSPNENPVPLKQASKESQRTLLPSQTLFSSTDQGKAKPQPPCAWHRYPNLHRAGTPSSQAKQRNVRKPETGKCAARRQGLNTNLAAAISVDARWIRLLQSTMKRIMIGIIRGARAAVMSGGGRGGELGGWWGRSRWVSGGEMVSGDAERAVIV